MIDPYKWENPEEESRNIEVIELEQEIDNIMKDFHKF